MKLFVSLLISWLNYQTMKLHGKQILFCVIFTISFVAFYKLLVFNTQWFLRVLFQVSSTNLQKTNGNFLSLLNSGTVKRNRDIISKAPESDNKNNQDRDIVFIRTSTEELESFEMCALYAAAKHNPDSVVIMFSFRKFALPTYLKELGNVESRILNFSEIFHATPLQHWYESKIWNVSAFVRRVRFLCDASRAAYLYKHGGTYFDTDIICLKDLKSVKNSLGHQSSHELNGAFLTMEKYHPFMRLTMEIEAETFDPKKSEIVYGPLLLTKAFKVFEQKKNEHTEWPEVNKLSMDLIYPFPYAVAEKLHHTKVGGAPLEEKRLREALVVHLWRNKMRSLKGNPKLTLKKESILYQIAKEHCEPVLPEWMTN